jgi:hypothetical protein
MKFDNRQEIHQMEYNKWKREERSRTNLSHEIRPRPCAASAMAIQTKQRKVICKVKNTLIQEFQLDMESQLIQVWNVKMHMIQFVSMMMVIQMKLMKAIHKKKNMMNKEFQLDMESKLI